MRRRHFGPAFFVLIVLCPLLARATPWLEYSMGLRLLGGNDDVAGISSGAFAFMDQELALMSPGLTLPWGDVSLHATGFGEVMIGYGRQAAVVTHRIGDQVVETSEEAIGDVYLSAVAGLGAQALFGDKGGVQLLFAQNLERGYFNRSYDANADPDDSAAFFDTGWEPLLRGFWKSERRSVEAAIGWGWYRLGLRRPSPFTRNQYAWIEYRLEYLHEKSAAFDYHGISFRIALGGSLGD